MQHLLILGKNGQVGSELQRSLSALGRVTALGHSQCDLSQPEALRHTLNTLQPTVVVNAAAYTAVDKAEQAQQAKRVHTINAQAVEVMGQYAHDHRALVVHYSTDYVFDGSQSQRAYTEHDPTRPLNVYGQSKLAGEMALRHSGAPHLIFRTSWVYAAHGNNFLRTMMRLAQQRQHLTVVADQFGAPTSAELIADLTALAIWAQQRDQLDSGLYHLTAAGQTSWHGFARYIVQQMIAHGLTPSVLPDAVQAIASADYPTPASRPLYSHLDCSLLQQKLGVVMPHWQLHVKRAIREVIGTPLD